MLRPDLCEDWAGSQTSVLPGPEAGAEPGSQDGPGPSPCVPSAGLPQVDGGRWQGPAAAGAGTDLRPAVLRQLCPGRSHGPLPACRLASRAPVSPSRFWKVSALGHFRGHADCASEAEPGLVSLEGFLGTGCRDELRGFTCSWGQGGEVAPLPPPEKGQLGQDRRDSPVPSKKWEHLPGAATPGPPHPRLGPLRAPLTPPSHPPQARPSPSHGHAPHAPTGVVWVLPA